MKLATFPLHPIVDGHCSCPEKDCTNVGKHPAYPFSSLEEGQQIPLPEGAGYGIATGSRSGIFVVDLDGEDAVRYFDALGTTPATFTVRTGREELGVHLYFALPDDFIVSNDQGRILGHSKIDIRGEGGFIVGPGSPHRSGKSYTIVHDLPPATAPIWLLEKLRNKTTIRRDATFGAPIVVDMESKEGQRRQKLAKKFLTEEAEPAVQGQNGSRSLWLVAQTLVRSYQLPLEWCAEAIEEHYNPRCSPEWSEQEIWHKLEDARDNGTWLTGIPSENFPQNLIEAGKPAATKNVPREIAPKRRMPSQHHVYTHVPGHNAAAGERRKICLTDAVNTLVCHPDWLGVWQYDEFRKTTIAVDPPMELDAERTGLSESDVGSVRTWFETTGVNITDKEVSSAIHIAAKRQKFHPVREYLESLPVPTDTRILDTLCAKAFGVEGATEAKFMKMFLVAAVRRILEPGCKVDTMLVLYSAREGRHKSTFVETLFGKKWYRGQMPSLEGRDASHALEGFWGIELAEMDRIVRTESTTTKDFLSRATDNYRQFGNGEKIEHLRECVFIGTTNLPDFLEEGKHSRRYLPIEIIDVIDLEYVREHRDDIWAAAVLLAKDASFKHYFTTEDEDEAAAVRERFEKTDPWRDMIVDYCAGKEYIKGVEEIYVYGISHGDMGAPAKMSKREQNRIGRELRNLGCINEVYKEGGASRRRWKISETLKNAVPTAQELKRRAMAAAYQNLSQS